MSIVLRCVLIVAALFSAVWIIHRIRKSKVKLEDTLFWIGTAFILALLGLFPQISYSMAVALGIQSPANFIFLVMICLLFEKLLTLSIVHSQMEDKYVTMAAEMALRCQNLEKQLSELQQEVNKSNATEG